MGFFKDIEIDVIDMYREDGLKEEEIAKIRQIKPLYYNEM